jgi:hypothetical protein
VNLNLFKSGLLSMKKIAEDEIVENDEEESTRGLEIATEVVDGAGS